MAIGESNYVNTFLRFISDENKKDMENYFLNSLTKDYTQFSSALEVDAAFASMPGFNYDESLYIAEYSGTNFTNINNAVRGRWNYEENGHISQMNRFKEDADKISSIIEKNPFYAGSFKAYRGVSLDYFKEYGISSLEDLTAMQGKFMFDQGFVSTSLLRDDSFFVKKPNTGVNYNIEIEYLIPEDFGDGVYIGDNPNLSYHADEHEYLINKGNLSRVASVRIDGDTAHLTMVMIPKSIYDDYYKQTDKQAGY